jgi:hypothetical protein
MEVKDTPLVFHPQGDNQQIENQENNALRKKIRKLRRKKKKALQTLKDIPVLAKEHEKKLSVSRTVQKKLSDLNTFIIQLGHDIEKRTSEFPVMYQMLVPRVVMEYSVFPDGVSRMILDFLDMDGQALLRLSNIPFVRLNLERYSSMLTSVDVLIKEQEIATSQHKKDQERLVKVKGKVTKMQAQKRTAHQEVEYARKQMSSTRVNGNNTIRFLLKKHVVGVTVPIIMAYIDNQGHSSADEENFHGRPRYSRGRYRRFN